jgi:tetratricopeptide (TPR) repeat protein
MRERHLTRELTIEVLERRARQMGINNFALSLRQLDRWLAQEVGDPRAVRCGVAEAEFGYPIRRLLASGRGNPDGEAGGREIVSPLQHFDVIVTHLAQIDHLQGARSALEPAMAVCRSVLAAAREATGAERHYRLRLAARSAELVGWFYQDSGMSREAREWTAQALDLAEAANAQSLLPYILMRRSAIAADLGCADDALLLAERALRRADGGVERALALREIAAAHALKRDGRAFRRSVDAALDNLSSGATHALLAPYCTVPYLYSEAGGAALALGDLNLAVDYLIEAKAGWPEGQPRDQALGLARLALAHARTGELERAEAVAMEAVTAATDCTSSRFTETLRAAVEVVNEKRGPRGRTDIAKQLFSLA